MYRKEACLILLKALGKFLLNFVVSLVLAVSLIFVLQIILYVFFPTTYDSATKMDWFLLGLLTFYTIFNKED